MSSFDKSCDPHPVFRPATHEEPPIIIDDTGSLVFETADGILTPDSLTGTPINAMTVASFDERDQFNAVAFGPITEMKIVLGKDGAEIGTVSVQVFPQLIVKCPDIKKVDGGTLGRDRYKLDVFNGQTGFKIRAISVRMAGTEVDMPVVIPSRPKETQLLFNLFTTHTHPH